MPASSLPGVIGVALAAIVAILALLLPVFVYGIYRNTLAMRRDLRRLADEASETLNRPPDRY